MVATSRIQFPDDMIRTVRAPASPSLVLFAKDALGRIQGYARDEPVSFALWAVGVGFVLGWTLKP